ncbi:MAG: hypothetical protein AAF456_10075 [Planctomycetota bacterium]
MNINKFRQLIIAVVIPVCLSLNFWFVTPEITMTTIVGLIVLWSLFIGLAPRNSVLAASSVLSVCIATILAPALGAMLAVAVFLFFGLRYCTESQRGFFHAMLFATVGYGFLSLLDRSGLFWNETSRLAWQISHELIYTDRRPERLGMFHLGLVPVVFSFLLLFSRLFFFKATVLDHLFFLFALVVATVLCAITKTQYLLLFFPAFLTFGRAFERSHFPSQAGWSRYRMIGAGLCAAGLCVLALTSLNGAGQATERIRNVLVLDGGLKSLERLDATDFEGDDGAKFSGFCHLVECNGWNCDIVEQDMLNQQVDPGLVDLFVIINPTEEFTDAQQEVLTNYVSEGGKLLVLGDHTDIGGVMKPLNQAISMTDIEFNFDSAIPEDRFSQWRRSLRGSFHPVFKDCENSDTGISVGASLNCTGNSRIVVQAISGYSDTGRPEFGVSRLGDMTYNIGEESGDLALVAEQRVGNGIVQVWGDTSGLQDGRLFLTADFMSRNLAWLSDYKPGLLSSRKLTAAFLALTLLGSVVVLARSPVWLLGLSFAVVSGVALVDRACDFEHRWEVNSRQIVFDDSHMSRYPEEEFHKGFSRFYELCLRSGHYLRRCDDFSAINETPAAWVVNAPVRSYTPDETESLLSYVRRGGSLFIVAGQDSAPQISEISAALGFSIDESPYGAAHNARLQLEHWRKYVLGETDAALAGDLIATSEEGGKLPEPEANSDSSAENANQMSDDERLAVVTEEEEESEEAYDAEITFRESYPIIVSEGAPEVDVVVDCWERPLFVRKQIGLGQVYFIADSRFLLDENLEFGSGAYKRLNLENAKLIIRCLER